MSASRMVRLAGVLLSILSLASAQGVLVNGNSQLPECAKGCQLLVQAATACSGTTSASAQTWNCFCQSAYLLNLRTSAVGICDQVCTDQTQNAQVSTWYKSNCGNDNGASEHGSDTGSTGNTNNQQAGTGTQANRASTTTSSVATASPASDLGSSSGSGGWFSNHYQWIIMLIVLLIGLSGLGFLLTWLRKRWERKQDQTTNGFNAGVTTQTAPGGRFDPNASQPRVAEPVGRDSAARTRESFMPYGYGYTRSESRTGSRSSGLYEQRRTPAPRGVSPLTEREKEIAVGGDMSDIDLVKPPPKRVLVRERSGQESMNGEKF